MEENSSNALLMAGGVLIGVMILSLVVFVFTYSANVARTYETTMEETNLATFNRQFEVFEGRNDIKIHDIISIANLAKQINEQNDASSLDNIYHITVKIEGINNPSYSSLARNIEQLDNDKIIEFLTSEETAQADGNKILYSCINKDNYEAISYSKIGRVNKIIFKKN